MPQYLILVIFLEVIMAKFKKVTKNDLRKYLMDQLKYAPDCLERRVCKSLKEIDSEAAEQNRESNPIQDEHFWVKTPNSSVFLFTQHVPD